LEEYYGRGKERLYIVDCRNYPYFIREQRRGGGIRGYLGDNVIEKGIEMNISVLIGLISRAENAA
jgi:hypothetical protein